MNTFLWILQVLLAITFGFSGIMKSTQAREKLVSMGQTGVTGLTYATIRFIGITEVLGAIGIVLPWTLNVLPVLTPVTAICFAVIMIPAMTIHYKRKEYTSVMLNVFLLCFSLFVAYMRFSQIAG